MTRKKYPQYVMVLRKIYIQLEMYTDCLFCFVRFIALSLYQLPMVGYEMVQNNKFSFDERYEWNRGDKNILFEYFE